VLSLNSWLCVNAATAFLEGAPADSQPRTGNCQFPQLLSSYSQLITIKSCTFEMPDSLLSSSMNE
jgi:hypothetical protein